MRNYKKRRRGSDRFSCACEEVRTFLSSACREILLRVYVFLFDAHNDIFIFFCGESVQPHTYPTPVLQLTAFSLTLFTDRELRSEQKLLILAP